MGQWPLRLAHVGRDLEQGHAILGILCVGKAMSDLWTQLFGSAHGYVMCSCGSHVENTDSARSDHVCTNSAMTAAPQDLPPDDRQASAAAVAVAVAVQAVKALEDLIEWTTDYAAPLLAEIERLKNERVHIQHCNFGENYEVCKYGEENCPALSESWSWFGKRLEDLRVKADKSWFRAADANGRTEKAEAERDALKQEVERYRWLRNSPLADVRIIGIGKRDGDGLDSTIDAQIGKGII